MEDNHARALTSSPLVGLGLDGPSFTPRNQPTSGARLGEPTWGANAPLRDLELRLGLSGKVSPRSVRVPGQAARIIEAADASAFYAASFASDAVGTADALLAWRDTLVEAGWDGQEIRGGGERLAALELATRIRRKLVEQSAFDDAGATLDLLVLAPSDMDRARRTRREGRAACSRSPRGVHHGAPTRPHRRSAADPPASTAFVTPCEDRSVEDVAEILDVVRGDVPRGHGHLGNGRPRAIEDHDAPPRNASPRSRQASAETTTALASSDG